VLNIDKFIDRIWNLVRRIRKYTGHGKHVFFITTFWVVIRSGKGRRVKAYIYEPSFLGALQVAKSQQLSTTMDPSNVTDVTVTRGKEMMAGLVRVPGMQLFWKMITWLHNPTESQSVVVFDFPRTFHSLVHFRRLSATQIQTPLFSNFLFSFIFHFHKNTIIKTNVKYMMKLKEHGT